MAKSNKRQNVAGFSPEQIEEFRRIGQWPPPSGIVFMPNRRPQEEEILSLLDNLSRLVPPSQKKIIDQAKIKKQES
jgi:hypothetical protein